MDMDSQLDITKRCDFVGLLRKIEKSVENTLSQRSKRDDLEAEMYRFS